MVLWLWGVTIMWAATATILLIRNPLPFPDRGHRLYGVKDDHGRQIVVEMLRRVGGLDERFTFDSGATHQTLMWDGFTVINYVDRRLEEALGVSSTGLSIPVADPHNAARKAEQILKASGYTATAFFDIDTDLPSNHLAIVVSDAFDGWILVLRRPLIHMPVPKRRN